MDESEFVGLCRGVIGSGQRICLRQDCTIASHTSKKMAWMALAGEESHCMFIRGASGNEADSSSTIFSSPVLPGSYIQDAEWSELKTSPRSLESWQATFSALCDTFMSSGQDAIDGRTVADLLETTKSEIKFVFTPARKKVKLPPIQDDEMDVDRKLSPSSLMGSSVSTSSLSFLKVPHELGTQPTSAFKNLTQGAWKDLLSNVAVLKGAVEEEQSKRRGVHSRVDEQLDEIHVKLSVLHELLGERPAAFGTLSAFGLLGQLSETVESMSQTVLDIKQKESSASVHPEVHQRLLVLEDHVDNFSSEVDKLCRKQIEQFFTSGDFRNHFIDPTMKLLSRSSLTTMDPGGKWDGELSDLKTGFEDAGSHPRKCGTYRDSDCTNDGSDSHVRLGSRCWSTSGCSPADSNPQWIWTCSVCCFGRAARRIEAAKSRREGPTRSGQIRFYNRRFYCFLVAEIL